MEPTVAAMVVLPLAIPVASPWTLIVATAGEDEVHTTDAEISCVLLSLKVPVAVNCFVVPIAVLGFAGVTVIETKVTAVTVRDAVPVTEPAVAVTVAVPT